MNKTKIEYLDYSWNPIKMRCTPVSEGCQKCWHLAMLKRFPPKKQLPYLDAQELSAPLKRKKPARIGVQFMGDLFHGVIPNRYIDDILETIAACPQHTFICLTKRPQNMENKIYGYCEDSPIRELGGGDFLPNLWWGISAENQERYDERAQYGTVMPMEKWIISLEPLLSSIILNFDDKPHIDWVIVGCESGSGRRECKIEWIQQIICQCADANIPVFVKQAEIDGKVVKMPKIFGKVWDEVPK